eukprot:m.959735 g.959735  ORF g.959735 m.959735 type:complete len:175 (+) comp23882_c0_seq62:1913-2437(+)
MFPRSAPRNAIDASTTLREFRTTYKFTGNQYIGFFSSIIVHCELVQFPHRLCELLLAFMSEENSTFNHLPQLYTCHSDGKANGIWAVRLWNMGSIQAQSIELEAPSASTVEPRNTCSPYEDANSQTNRIRTTAGCNANLRVIHTLLSTTIMYQLFRTFFIRNIPSRTKASVTRS